MKLVIDYEATEGVSLKEVVYLTIKKAITTGEMAFGERLLEIPTANDLGVSRTPVREAIKRLEKEGLVEIVPRCGARIKGVLEQDVCFMKETYEVRKVLEKMAVESAIPNITAIKLHQMKTITEKIEKTISTGTKRDLVQMDMEFHMVMCDIADNSVLKDMLKGLYDSLMRFLPFLFQNKESLNSLLLEHRNIIKALEKRDRIKVIEEIQKHSDNEMNKLCEIISNL